MLMDVAGPEPLEEVTSSVSFPWIIVAVVATVIIIGVTVYLVRKASKKNEKNNK